MSKSPTILDSVDALGNGIRIAFAWNEDRFAHSIHLLRDGRSLELLASLEGSDQQQWPPSPPLQQLCVEDHQSNGPVALLVGMAGKSHWSASVEARTDSTRVVFDMACRFQADPAKLGSTYRANGPFRLGTARHVDFDLEGERCRMTLLEADGLARAGFESVEGGLRIAYRPENGTPTTARWKYEVTFCPPA